MPTIAEISEEIRMVKRTMRALKKHIARIASVRSSLHAFKQGLAGSPIEEAGYVLELCFNPSWQTALQTLDDLLRHKINGYRERLQELSAALSQAQAKQPPTTLHKVRVLGIEVMLNARAQLGHTPAALLTSFTELLFALHETCNGALNGNVIEITPMAGDLKVLFWYEATGVASRIEKVRPEIDIHVTIEETPEQPEQPVLGEKGIVDLAISYLKQYGKGYMNKRNAVDMTAITLQQQAHKGYELSVNNGVLTLQFGSTNIYHFWFEGGEIWHKINNLPPRRLEV